MRLIAMLVLVAAVPACGITELAATSPSQVSTVDTPETTAKPKPTIRQLARRYEQIAARSNGVACSFNDALATDDLALIKQQAERFAQAQRKAADALRKLDFPRRIQRMVDEVIANRASLEAALLQLSIATDVTAANAALDRLSQVSDNGSAASNLVRGELGLPSVPIGVCG